MSKNKRFFSGRRRFLLAAAFVVLGRAWPARSSSVVDDFHGLDGLKVLVADFMDLLMKDSRTIPFFEKVDRDRVKQQLAIQFCSLLGGGCEYTGANMKGVHRGLGITMEDFNALIENLQDAMDKHGIPFLSQNKLLALLAPMYRDIVEK